MHIPGLGQAHHLCDWVLFYHGTGAWQHNNKTRSVEMIYFLTDNNTNIVTSNTAWLQTENLHFQIHFNERWQIKFLSLTFTIKVHVKFYENFNSWPKLSLYCNIIPILFEQKSNNWLNLIISLVDTHFRSKVYTSINSIFWRHVHEYLCSKSVLNKRSNFSQIIVFSLQKIGIISNKGYLYRIY